MIVLPGPLLQAAMKLSWALRLQGDSPVSGLEFIKYPPVVSTEKLNRELGFTFHYSSRDVVTTCKPKHLHT